MSETYIVNVSKVETGLGADPPRSVSVALICVSTGIANECSHTQCKTGLGSRAAFTAILGGVKWCNQGDGSTGSFCHRKQNLLGYPNCTVSGFLSHRCLGEESRFEILDRDTSKSRYNLARPFEGTVFSPTRNSNVNAGQSTLGFVAPFRSMLRARQLALRPFQCLRRYSWFDSRTAGQNRDQWLWPRRKRPSRCR